MYIAAAIEIYFRTNANRRKAVVPELLSALRMEIWNLNSRTCWASEV